VFAKACVWWNDLDGALVVCQLMLSLASTPLFRRFEIAMQDLFPDKTSRAPKLKERHKPFHSRFDTNVQYVQIINTPIS
jgi:hypothetical protein